MVQINCSFLLEKKQARTSLIKIISSLKYLAGQGLAIQGRNSDDGTLMSFLISLNGWMETDEWMETFNELFNLRAEDIAGFHS